MAGDDRPDAAALGSHLGDSPLLPADPSAGPGEALLAGPGRGVALGVHHADLPLLAVGVAADQDVERLLRAGAVRHQVEAVGAVGQPGEALGGHRADPGARPGDDDADVGELRLHGDPEVAVVRVESHDRERGRPWIRRRGPGQGPGRQAPAGGEGQSRDQTGSGETAGGSDHDHLLGAVSFGRLYARPVPGAQRAPGSPIRIRPAQDEGCADSPPAASASRSAWLSAVAASWWRSSR